VFYVAGAREQKTVHPRIGFITVDDEIGYPIKITTD